MSPMRWYFSFLKKYGLLIIVGLAMTTLISVFAIVNPYIAGTIVDEVISGGKTEMLPKLVTVMVAVTAVRGILRFLHLVVFENISQNVLYDMQDAVYHKLLLEDFHFYNKKKTGDLMSRQTGDMLSLIHI